MARVGIVDDNRELCTVMARSLHQHHEIVCFHDGVHALKELPAWHPDIVVMDVCLDERMDGLTCMSHLKSQGLDSRFVVITGYQPFDMAAKARDHGAHAFLSKPFAAVELRQTIDQLLTASLSLPTVHLHFEPSVIFPTPQTTEQPRTLSARERMILEHLRQYRENKTIAEKLGLSRRTVEAHLHRIYRKLEVHNRYDALRKCFSNSANSLVHLRSHQPFIACSKAILD